MSRPLIADRYSGAWLVVSVSVIVGVASILDFLGLWGVPPTWAPDDRLGVNYLVYHHAAEAAVAGEDFYAVTPPGFGDLYTYLYPPITVLAYVPFMLVSSAAGFAVHTAITLLACTVATAALVPLVERLDRPLGWVDVAGIWLFVAASVHAAPTLYFGNVNLLLAAAIVAGVLALERGREVGAGVTFGLAALVKVFPTLVGLYLLRVRAWRAVAAALATGAGGLAASALVFGPDTLRRFVVDVLLGRTDTAAFVGGYPPDGRYYVTLQRPLSHLLWAVAPDAPATVLPVLSVVVLAPVVAYCLLDCESALDRFVALHATLTAALLVMPSLRPHLVVLFVSWLPLLYAFHGRPAGWPFVAGGLLAAVPQWPDELAATARTLPEPLGTAGATAASVGTLQLYGLLAMLYACVEYQRRRGVGLASVREAGRPLRRAADEPDAD